MTWTSWLAFRSHLGTWGDLENGGHRLRRVEQKDESLCPRVDVLSHVWLFATLWSVTRQAPLSMEFSGSEYWNQMPFPTPGDLPNPGVKPESLCLLCSQVDSLLRVCLEDIVWLLYQLGYTDKVSYILPYIVYVQTSFMKNFCLNYLLIFNIFIYLFCCSGS